jgi:hypothetical protein
VVSVLLVVVVCSSTGKNRVDAEEEMQLLLLLLLQSLWEVGEVGEVAEVAALVLVLGVIVGLRGEWEVVVSG